MRKIIIEEVMCLKNDPPAKDVIAGGYWIKSGFQNGFGLLGLVFPDELDLDFLDLDFGFSGLIGLMDFQELDTWFTSLDTGFGF